MKQQGGVAVTAVFVPSLQLKRSLSKKSPLTSASQADVVLRTIERYKTLTDVST